MGRFETLNADTQDLVNCLLPALASAFKVSDPVDIIPEDIRMRAWDCDRRDHIVDQTENDARNWGVQFLRDLMAISRLINGNIAVFHADLRAKVALHEPKHPWCRLADIKEIKDEYVHPELKNKKPVQEEESSGSSTDSYLEELVEPDDPRGSRRGKKTRNHEMYEARVQEPRKRRKLARLRRAEDGGYHRPEKTKKKDMHGRFIADTRSPSINHQAAPRRKRRAVPSDSDSSSDPAMAEKFGPRRRRHLPNPHYSPSPVPAPAPAPAPEPVPAYVYEVDTSTEPLAVQKMAAELEVAEAELRAARLKYAYIQAKEQAEREALYG